MRYQKEKSKKEQFRQQAHELDKQFYHIKQNCDEILQDEDLNLYGYKKIDETSGIAKNPAENRKKINQYRKDLRKLKDDVDNLLHAVDKRSHHFFKTGDLKKEISEIINKQEIKDLKHTLDDKVEEVNRYDFDQLQKK